MEMHEATARRLLLAAVAVGFALRLAFGVIYWTGKPLTHDEREYLSLAGSVAAGRGFVYDESFEVGTGQQFGRAPGYPLFLAAIGAGSPAQNGTPLRVKVAQSVIGAAGVLVIGLIARRAGGSASAAVAAWIAALYPPLVALPSYVLSETLYSLVALTAVLVLQAAVTDEPGNGRSLLKAVAAGVLTGAAALIRPAMLFFVPLAILWLALRRQSASLLLFAAAAALVILPWTLRNVRVYGRPVLIASEGGVTFWTGNHPLATGEGDLAANPAIKAAELEFRHAHPGMSPDQLEPIYYADALTYIRAHPGWWLTLLARKAFYTVVPLGPSYALHSARYRAASAAPYLVLLPFAAAGARRLWRGSRPPTALALLAGSALLVSLVFFPQERFRIPVIDPTLIVCASGLAGRSRL
jgi:hypothetical protein